MEPEFDFQKEEISKELGSFNELLKRNIDF